MSSSDDYIIITESHDLDEGPIHSGVKVHEEGENASLGAFESQGISIIGGEEGLSSEEPRDQFSQELMDEAGIEILSGEEEEESFL